MSMHEEGLATGVPLMAPSSALVDRLALLSERLEPLQPVLR
jgi:hypothetical protein